MLKALIFSISLMSCLAYGKLNPDQTRSISKEVIYEQHKLNNEFPNLNLSVVPFVDTKDTEKLVDQIETLKKILNGDINSDNAENINLDLLVCSSPQCGGGGSGGCCGPVCGCML